MFILYVSYLVYIISWLSLSLDGDVVSHSLFVVVDHLTCSFSHVPRTPTISGIKAFISTR